jgi:uncharacterized membrane protein YhaH (DUF805 family)
MWAWVKHCFTNYAVFEGRAARPEYWWFHLLTSLCNVAIYIVTVEATYLRLPFQLFWVVLLGLPSLAVTSRRLHDTGHSFWWIGAPILGLIPLIVTGLIWPGALKGSFFLMAYLLAFFGLSIWLLVLYCSKGDPGPNRYGDPAPTTPG